MVWIAPLSSSATRRWPLEIVLDDRRELERRGATADAIAANPRYVELASEMPDELARMEDDEPAGPAPAGEPLGGGDD